MFERARFPPRVAARFQGREGGRRGGLLARLRRPGRCGWRSLRKATVVRGLGLRASRGSLVSPDSRSAVLEARIPRLGNLATFPMSQCPPDSRIRSVVRTLYVRCALMPSSSLLWSIDRMWYRSATSLQLFLYSEGHLILAVCNVCSLWVLAHAPTDAHLV